MEDSFLGRLVIAIDIGGGAVKVAESAGMSDRTIRNYLKGATEPKAEAIERIAKAAGVRAEWLFTGSGERMAAPRAEQPRAGYVYLPLYDVRAAAGRGKLVESEEVVDVLAFKEDWIRQELRARPADLRLIYVEGDSMEPDLRAGDIVLLDHTDTLASREGIYVLRMDGALLVKSLQRLPGGIVKVNSRNPSYEAFTVKIADIAEPNGFAVIGRVVWACRRF